MSEHLFKAKDAETKKWVEGYLWSDRTIGVTSPCGNVDEVVIDPDTVCQYIGRTDSLGEEIFENDILSVKNESGEVYHFVMRYGVCGGLHNVDHEVGYIGFYLDGGNEETRKCLEHGVRNDIVYWLNEYHCEVVGNTFDETGGGKMSQRLYKAKADHNGEWVFGYYLEVGGVPFILPEGKPLNAIVQVRPETVCQCVGMIDRNGITSFEFDKVFDPNVRKTFLIKSDKELSGFLLVDEAGWETKDISRLFYCEIVGNIYDKVFSHA